MNKAILATKVGMTQIFNENGVLTPVTVLQAGPCYVTQVKTVDNDGYSAVQVGFVDKKDKVITKDASGKKEIKRSHGVNKPLQGHFAKAGVSGKRTAKNIVIAHRGYWNTPGAFENSIKAIDNAMNFGIYGSEFDINFTADDSIVVVHGSKHPVVKDLVIQESTFDKVRNTLLGNGEKVPTLREYLLAGKSDPSTQLILEIKKHPTPERENEIVAKTMAMVEELGLEKRVEYISFSWNICEQIRKADRKAVVYYLNGEKSPAELKKAGMNGLDYSLKVIKKHPEWVKQAHDLGLEVNVWTVDTEEDMRYFIDLGVDYITTDYPERLQALLK